MHGFDPREHVGMQGSRAARRLVDDGVHGARMTGAGFGGCTVHLARSDVVAELRERVEPLLRPGGGVIVVEGAVEAGWSSR